ncbi:ABC transporter permease [Marinobacter sp. ANT_B65]|uniref:ABC transporter permease n=1 Tax=Marinobacter sp. ANT_B65 TaxID=2039467 RepID=UPI000BBEC833|nr:ABC transporter permease [Marinobacter sp. ANT_B65]PCM45249.1 ABC transporter [Marinobacter sp. ANT_B65]
MIRIAQQLWLYRNFITGSVKREFQSKYMNSLLGVAWAVIQPLSMILVYTLIFSQIMRAKLPGVESQYAYSIYLCSGVLTWGLFSEVTSRTQNMFLDNANLLKKLSFPWYCLPVTVIASAGLNFLIIFILFAIFLVVTGNFPGWVVLTGLPVLAVQLFLAGSLGLMLAVLNVFFRDVGQLYTVILQFWFWLTPIVYPLEILPDRLQSIIQLNPMTSLISAYQDLFTLGKIPDWTSLLPTIAVAVVFFLLAVNLFRKHANEIVDEL